MRVTFFVPASLLALLMGPNLTNAGGPRLNKDNKPIAWEPPTPICYRISQGTLGPIKEKKVQDLIKEAFDTWTGVKTATVCFRYCGVAIKITSAAHYRAV